MSSKTRPKRRKPVYAPYTPACASDPRFEPDGRAIELDVDGIDLAPVIAAAAVFLAENAEYLAFVGKDGRNTASYPGQLGKALCALRKLQESLNVFDRPGFFRGDKGRVDGLMYLCRGVQGLFDTITRPDSPFAMRASGMGGAQVGIIVPAGEVFTFHSGCVAEIEMGATELRAATAAEASADGRPELLPRWDHACKQLWLGTELARTYKRHAEKQFEVLDAFETAGWKFSIPNPPSILNVKDTIEGLNDGLAATRLRFQKGEAGGQTVIRWCLWPV